MRERSKSLNIILLIIYLIFVLIPSVGEDGGYPLIGSIIEGAFRYLSSALMILVFVIIIVHFILLKRKKEYPVLQKMLVFCQSLLLIALLIDSFYIFPIMLMAMILLMISLFQMLFLFFTSAKGLKYGLIIVCFISLLSLSYFWYLNATVSRFEFELNEDGKSYAIVEIKSDIHTVRIPSTYKGLPVTRIERTGQPMKWNIEEIFIPIEIIYLDKYAISYCPNAIIYCEAGSKPDTWDVNWCFQVQDIIWGYQE